MECRTCFESLTALIDGELSGAESESLQQHLDDCEGCLEQYDSLRYATSLVDSLPEPFLAAPSFVDLEGRLPRGGSRFFDWGGYLIPRWVPAAALATILVFVSFPFYWISSSEREEMERMFNAFVQERERLEEEHQRTESSGSAFAPPNPFARQVSLSDSNPFSLR